MIQVTNIKATTDQLTDSGEVQYDIHVRADSQSLVFHAEVSPGPSGPQLDWSDDFQDLLMAHRADFSAVSLLLLYVHSGDSVTFPVEIGAAA